MIVDLSIHATLYAWMPHPNSPAVFYIISGMWGITDGIWQTQINGTFYLLIFLFYCLKKVEVLKGENRLKLIPLQYINSRFENGNFAELTPLSVMTLRAPANVAL